jgi:hypothetical protein
MPKSFLFAGGLLAGLAASGCTPYAMPCGSPYGTSYRYPIMTPAYRPMGDTYATPWGRWDRVMLLPSDSMISVLTMDGVRVGKLTRADGYGVQASVSGMQAQIARADVMRIDLVDLPGSEVAAVAKRTAGGAALGLGAAALVAGVLGGDAWPPPGALLRAGAATGGVVGAQSALIDRQSRVIYIAESQPPLSRYSGRPHESTRPVRPLASYPAANWSAIEELRAHTVVAVVTTSGARHEGSLIGVDETALGIDFRGAELHIQRRSVLRVDVLDEDSSLLRQASR